MLGYNTEILRFPKPVVGFLDLRYYHQTQTPQGGVLQESLVALNQSLVSVLKDSFFSIGTFVVGCKIIRENKLYLCESIYHILPYDE
ncbi:hypothetical protein J6590_050314 [Homalodisca vitripennis]|nr:hypothetical protein J6590_050314 [Homalodisca vitripennis]